MARKVSISFNWQGPMDYDQALARVRLADEAGVDTAWVAEAWGRDCFTILALMARETQRMQLGTGIVNTYSRTPAALAQHFATLDELSGGRMVIGLGTSGHRRSRIVAENGIGNRSGLYQGLITRSRPSFR